MFHMVLFQRDVHSFPTNLVVAASLPNPFQPKPANEEGPVVHFRNRLNFNQENNQVARPG